MASAPAPCRTSTPTPNCCAGRLLFEDGGANPLLAALPDEIVIRTADAPLMARFRHLLEDIRDEMDSARPGSDIIAGDLARALFVTMLRDHLTNDALDDGTLLLLRDKTTARVVLAVLGDLARDWTLDDLAQVAIASRATLVRAFRKVVGVAPMAFLSDLRLSVARQRLAGTNDPVADIAADVGYSSEGALSKAVLRKFGLRPGALRLKGPDIPGK
jgi:AraC family transcriptional activator of mtrCDE